MHVMIRVVTKKMYTKYSTMHVCCGIAPLWMCSYPLIYWAMQILLLFIVNRYLEGIFFFFCLP